MKYIEKLLNGAEVKWMPLGEVVTLEKGKQLNKRLLTEDGAYPAYNGGVSYSGFTSIFNYSENKIIVSQGGASAGFVNFISTKFYANAHCYVVLPNLSKVDNRYIYHLLKLNQEKLMGKQLGAGIPALRSNEILGLIVPIPPFHVQEEIVRILDKFTTLETELEAELDCRKRQYQYYRDQSLSFGMLKRGGQKLNNIEIIALGEMCSVQRGKRLTKRDLNHNGRYPVFHGGIEPIGYYSSSNREANSVMVINVGASAGTVGYSSKEFWSSDGCFCFSHCKQLNQKYLFYALQSMENSIKGQVRKAGIPTLDNKVVEKLKIPIPPLAEQQRIVSILDKFEALTTSISEGLPKEIELRRKQYEYYRNQLLSFA